MLFDSPKSGAPIVHAAGGGGQSQGADAAHLSPEGAIPPSAVRPPGEKGKEEENAAGEQPQPGEVPITAEDERQAARRARREIGGKPGDEPGGHRADFVRVVKAYRELASPQITARIE